MSQIQEAVKQEAKPQAGGWGAPAAPLTLPGGRVVNQWLVLTSLMFGFFMALLDATIVNIAIPSIQTSLHTTLTTVSWVSNAYNLVFAVLLVTTGRFADQFGRKRMFMIGMVMFSIGSLLCAFAPTIEWLIGFRAVQALGAAALTPVSLAIITAVFPAKQRGAAIGIWGAAAGLASAAGPVLGGFLVQSFGWPAIFLVNLPFCIVGLFMVFTFVPEMRDPNANRRIDVAGLLTLTVGLFCLVLAIIQGNDWGWTSAGIFGLFAGAIIGLALFYVVETRQEQPIFDFSLFRIRSFTTANITMLLFGIAIQGAFLILVLFFVIAQGKSVLDAAYAIIPLPLASFFFSAISGAISGKKVSPRVLGIIGMALLTIGFYLFSTISASVNYFDFAWRDIIVGAGMGLVFTSLPNIVLSELPRHKLGVGSGAFNTFRQVGFVLGVAILISLLTGQISSNVATAKTSAVAIVQADNKLPAQLRTTIASNIQNAASQSSSQFDLTTIADRIPGGAALKPELASLNRRIATLFAAGINDAFTLSWFVSAIIALLGLIAALLTRAAHPAKASNEEASWAAAAGA